MNSLGVWQKGKHASLGEKRPFDPIERQEMEHWLSLSTSPASPTSAAPEPGLLLAPLLHGNFVCIYITNFIF